MTRQTGLPWSDPNSDPLGDVRAWMEDERKRPPAPVRYAVLRGAPDLPDGYMPAELEGLWLDLGALEAPVLPVPPTAGRAYATDRHEVREDGAQAQVYEVRA